MTRRKPIATIAVLLVTAAITGAQLVQPAVLTALRRDPEALAAGEWWRMVSPLFVQADGWPQIIGNAIALIAVGPLAERVFGAGGWLALYFGCGVVSEIPSYLWKPYGGGSSLGIAGLLGGLVGAVIVARRWLPVPVRVGCAVLVVLAVVDTAAHDNHGIPFLLGAALGAALARRDLAVHDRTRQLVDRRRPPAHGAPREPTAS